MTFREYLTWQEWIDDQWNQPSRSDYYQMQTAALAGHLKIGNLDKMRINFETQQRKVLPPLTEEDVAAITAKAKSQWASRRRRRGK